MTDFQVYNIKKVQEIFGVSNVSWDRELTKAISNAVNLIVLAIETGRICFKNIVSLFVLQSMMFSIHFVAFS